MENTVFYIVLSFLLPIIYLCVYLEKRARRIMISFCCGVIACMAAYILNTVFVNQLRISTYVYTIFCSPFIEELLKFLPIFLIALIVNKGRRGSTANAYSVGIGFCLVENTFYLAEYLSSANVIWIIFRSIGTGLMHGMSATIIGLGIYSARKNNKHTALLIACTYIAAVLYHGVFNFLVQGNAIMRGLAVLMPLITHLLILFLVKREDIDRFLSETDDSDDLKYVK